MRSLLLSLAFMVASLLSLPAAMLAEGSAEKVEKALRYEMSRAELKESQKLDQEILAHFSLNPDPLLNDRVAAIMDRLIPAEKYPKFKPTIRILEGNEISSLIVEGGYLYVFKGLLQVAHNDDELAMALAHEWAHGELGHKLAKRGPEWSSYGVLIKPPSYAGKSAEDVSEEISELTYTPYSRDEEREADFLAVLYLERAGYQSSLGVSFLHRVEAARREAINHAKQHFKDSYAAVLDAQHTGDQKEYEIAQQRFEAVKRDYLSAAFQFAPLWQEHPVDQERGSFIFGVSGYLHGTRSMDSLVDAQLVRRISEAMQRFEGRSLLLKPK